MPRGVAIAMTLALNPGAETNVTMDMVQMTVWL
jgi:hypothetical protein